VLTFAPDMVPERPEQAYTVGRTIGTRFGRRHGARFPVVEVGNELDIPAMKPGHPTGGDVEHYRPDEAVRFAAILRGIIEGLKAEAPGIRTIVNTAQSHTGFIRILLDRGVPFDIIGWHLYVDESGYGDDPPNGGDYRAALGRLQGFGREIWITEVNRYRGAGPGNAREVEQATMLARLADEMSVAAGVRAFLVYQLYDEPGATLDGNEDEAYYGLVRCAGPLERSRGCAAPELKPAFLALRRGGRLLATAPGISGRADAPPPEPTGARSPPARPGG
jgi:hypothetical protein